MFKQRWTSCQTLCETPSSRAFFLVHSHCVRFSIRKSLKREEQQLTSEREKKRQAIALLETQIHRAEMQLSEKRHQLEHREGLEKRKEEARVEIERHERRQKVRFLTITFFQRKYHLLNLFVFFLLSEGVGERNQGTPGADSQAGGRACPA
jgi:TolA-binding protein